MRAEIACQHGDWREISRKCQEIETRNMLKHRVIGKGSCQENLERVRVCESHCAAQLNLVSQTLIVLRYALPRPRRFLHVGVWMTPESESPARLKNDVDSPRRMEGLGRRGALEHSIDKRMLWNTQAASRAAAQNRRRRSARAERVAISHQCKVMTNKKIPPFPPLPTSSHRSPLGTSYERQPIALPLIARHLGMLSIYQASQDVANLSTSRMCGLRSTFR